MCFIKVYVEWDSYKCVLLKCTGSGILTSVFIKVYGKWDSYKCVY